MNSDGSVTIGAGGAGGIGDALAWDVKAQITHVVPAKRCERRHEENYNNRTDWSM
jgi:predicted dinucleotide-binding enzyme